MRLLLCIMLALLAGCASTNHEATRQLSPGELDVRIVQPGWDFNSRYDEMKQYAEFQKAVKLMGPTRAEVVIDRLGPAGVRVFYVAGNPTLYPSEYLEALVVCKEDTSRVPANEWYLMRPDRTLLNVYELGSPFTADNSLLRNKQGYFLIVADFSFHCNGEVTRVFNGEEVR